MTKAALDALVRPALRISGPAVVAPSSTGALTDDPLRYQLANELHARPFPVASAPGWVAFLAIRSLSPAGCSTVDTGRPHLLALLDRFGSPHPPPGATSWYGSLGRHQLKWESHTEFVTYTALGEGNESRPFDPLLFDVFPKEWLATAPGVRVTSVLIHIEEADGDQGIAGKLNAWFVPESLAVSRLLEDELIGATDFRIDPAGHMRVALFVRPGVSDRRVGRVVQRLCEIETYKAMAMLGHACSRDLQPQMAVLDQRLTSLVAEMAGTGQAEELLHGLLAISSTLEATIAQSSFRFGATAAYEAIVKQRVQVLREERFEGYQTLSEFMARRFDPAMRTASSADRRLQAMADRAIRAGDLLRTRVDVERSAQNQRLLESMDRRADHALRLQHTVEGLSVVAISYYAVGLMMHLLAPIATMVDEAWLSAAATPLVVLASWIGIRLVRRSLKADEAGGAR